KENYITITLNNDVVVAKLIEYNPTLFKSSIDVNEFCSKYSLKIEQFIVPGKFSQLEMELEGISARLSSEIIFFRKKFFTELLIQKFDTRIFEVENIKNIIIDQNTKSFYESWKNNQLQEIELVQKYIKSPYVFNDLDQ